MKRRMMLPLVVMTGLSLPALAGGKLGSGGSLSKPGQGQTDQGQTDQGQTGQGQTATVPGGEVGMTQGTPEELPYVAERSQRYLYQIMMNKGTIQEHIMHRCELDSLNNEQALGRILWLVKCQRPFISREVVRVAGGVFEGESAVMFFLQLYGIVTENGRYVSKDLQSGKRQFYPLIANAAATAAWIGPVSESTSCAAGAPIPSNYHWIADCLSSCYKPTGQLSFGDRTMAIGEARAQGRSEISVLSAESTLEQPVQTTIPLGYYVESFQDTWHDLIRLKTLSGGVLEVTDNHPLLDQNGVMKEAMMFNLADSLVTARGELDPIVEIEEERWFGKVMNLQPASEHKTHNIVIAGGYLSGSSWYQNDGESQKSRILERANIPDSALE